MNKDMTMKKSLIICVSVFLSLVVVAGLTFGIIAIVKRSKIVTHDFVNVLPEKNKIILFIGDGMGENHIEIAQTYLDKTVCFEGFQYKGHVTTDSTELLAPTDSAAAATALATGQKVKNGAVARQNDNNIKSITEYVKEKNLGVGIVTTDSLNGATPACFSAHANNRGDSQDIIESQLISNIDIFLGAGYSTYSAYAERFESAGYEFSANYSNLNINADKVIGSFSSIANSNPTDENPTLTSLVEFAVDFLEQKYPDGYFLMVEGAHIDKMSHDNRMLDMIEYLNEFDKAIAFARDRFVNDNDMAFIVTADHETGNLQKFVGTKEDIKDNLFTRTGHSSQNVKYYLHFCGGGYSVDMPQIIDNTDIFRMCYNMLIARE